MQTQLMTSLKVALENHFGMEVVIARDGARYPDVKPYFVIKQINNVPVYVSKQREAINVKHYVQVSLIANSYFEMLAYQDELRDYFLFEEVNVVTDTGLPTDMNIVFTVMNEVSLFNDDASNPIQDNQVHFDIMAENTKHKNRGTK